MLLLLNVLLDKREWCAPGGRTKIRIRPQCWQFPLQHGKLLTQETRGTALDQLHQAMNAKLGIDAHQQMDMIEHHFEFFDLGLMLFTYLTDNLFQSLLNRRQEHLPAIFGTPDHMIVAGIKNVPVGLLFLAHTIHYTPFCYLFSKGFVLAFQRFPSSPTPKKN